MGSFIGDISNVSGLKKPTVAAKSTNRSAGLSDLDMTDFLQMMVAQFQNQDPENAASTTDMLNQMVQMSMIQAISNVTDAVTLTYTASLVGKEVTVGTYDSDGKLNEIVGTVTGTGTFGGSPVVFVDGVCYDVSSIMAVGRLPEQKPPEEKPPEEKPDGGVGEGDGNQTIKVV